MSSRPFKTPLTVQPNHTPAGPGNYSPTATQLSANSVVGAGNNAPNSGTSDISESAPSAWGAPAGAQSASVTRGTITPELAEQNDQDFLTMDENGQPYSTLIGKTIDSKYLVQSVLGEGGMAVVYRAHHLQMERIVVIKVMQGWLTSNKTSVERFEREGKLTAKLNHPNIVAVYDVGSIDGREPYIVNGIHQGRGSGRSHS